MIKLKDIARVNGFNKTDFENFCINSNVLHITGPMFDSLDEREIDYAVWLYRLTPEQRAAHFQTLENQERQKNAGQRQIEEERRRQIENRRAEALSRAEQIRTFAREEMANGWLFSVEGVRGRSMRVYPYKAVIKTDVTVGSVLTQNATDGEKTIYFKDVIGVQYKKAGATVGYLQLETAAESMNNKGSNAYSENTFTFNSNTDEIAALYEYIIGRLDELKRY